MRLPLVSAFHPTAPLPDRTGKVSFAAEPVIRRTTFPTRAAPMPGNAPAPPSGAWRRGVAGGFLLALGAFARLQGLDGAHRAGQPAGSEPGGAQVPRPVLAARDLKALLAPHDTSASVQPTDAAWPGPGAVHVFDLARGVDGPGRGVVARRVPDDPPSRRGSAAASPTGRWDPAVLAPASAAARVLPLA